MDPLISDDFNILLQNRGLLPIYRLYCCALRLEDYVDLYVDLNSFITQFDQNSSKISIVRDIIQKYFSDKSIHRVTLESSELLDEISQSLNDNQIPIESLTSLREDVVNFLKTKTLVSFTESKPYLSFIKGERASIQVDAKAQTNTKEKIDQYRESLKQYQLCINNIHTQANKVLDPKAATKSGLTLGNIFSQYAKTLGSQHPLAEASTVLGESLQQIEELQANSTKNLAKRLEAPMGQLLRNDIVAAQSQKRKYETKRNPGDTLILETYNILSECNQKCENQMMKSMCEVYEEYYQLMDHSLRVMRQLIPVMMEYRTMTELAELQLLGGYQIGSRVQIAESEIIKQGSIEKKGAKRRNWNERWFILKPKYLLYVTNSSEMILKGAIHLQNCIIEPAVHKKKPHCFSINTGLRTYFLSPPSEKEMKSWVNAIKGATVEHEAKQKLLSEKKQLDLLVESQASNYIDSFLSERKNTVSEPPKLNTSSSSVNSKDRQTLLDQIIDEDPIPMKVETLLVSKDLEAPSEPAPLPPDPSLKASMDSIQKIESHNQSETKSPSQESNSEEEEESDDYDESDEDETNFIIAPSGSEGQRRSVRKSKRQNPPEDRTSSDQLSKSIPVSSPLTDNTSQRSATFDESKSNTNQEQNPEIAQDNGGSDEENSQDDNKEEALSDTSSTDSRTTSTRSPNVLVKQGYLIKKGAKRRNWNTRWFILKYNHLAYYKNPGDREPKGVIILSNCKVESSDKRPHCFSITAPLRTYYIYAKNSSTQEEWMAAIRSCIPGT